MALFPVVAGCGFVALCCNGAAGGKAFVGSGADGRAAVVGGGECGDMCWRCCNCAGDTLEAAGVDTLASAGVTAAIFGFRTATAGACTTADVLLAFAFAAAIAAP
eukprot:15277500-Ditylum_brightwellii.AAC.1